MGDREHTRGDLRCHDAQGSVCYHRFAHAGALLGGWDFTEDDASSRLPAEIGYSKGVPMGGDLSNAPEDRSPTFLVGALKDPFSGNLDRIQIIKGWMDKDGNTHEKVYDVTWSDADTRKPGSDG